MRVCFLPAYVDACVLSACLCRCVCAFPSASGREPPFQHYFITKPNFKQDRRNVDNANKKTSIKEQSAFIILTPHIPNLVKMQGLCPLILVAPHIITMGDCLCRLWLPPNWHFPGSHVIHAVMLRSRWKCLPVFTEVIFYMMVNAQK